MDLCEASKMGDFTPSGLWSVSKLVIYEELKSEQKKTAHTQKLAISKKSTIFVQFL